MAYRSVGSSVMRGPAGGPSRLPFDTLRVAPQGDTMRPHLRVVEVWEELGIPA